MQNKKNFQTNPEMKEYFSKLPVFVQESITQSGINFDSVDQLQAFAEYLNKQNP